MERMKFTKYIYYRKSIRNLYHTRLTKYLAKKAIRHTIMNHGINLHPILSMIYMAEHQWLTK
jgi:hypothetical protein